MEYNRVRSLQQGFTLLSYSLFPSALFSRQPAMTVAFGFGKLPLGACGDLQVASESNNLKIHLIQTRSWTIVRIVNSGLASCR